MPEHLPDPFTKAAERGGGRSLPPSRGGGQRQSFFVDGPGRCSGIKHQASIKHLASASAQKRGTARFVHLLAFLGMHRSGLNKSNDLLIAVAGSNAQC